MAKVVKGKTPLQLFNELRPKFRKITFRENLLYEQASGEGKLSIWDGKLFLYPVHLNGKDVEQFASGRMRPYIDLQEARLELVLKFDPQSSASPADQFKAAARKVVDEYLSGKEFFLDPSRPLGNADLADRYHGNKSSSNIGFSIGGPAVKGLHLTNSLCGTWCGFIPDGTDEREQIEQACKDFDRAYRAHMKAAEKNFAAGKS